MINLLCFVYFNYLCVFKQKCKFNDQKCDISVISVDFFESFQRFGLIFVTRIRIIDTDQDSGGQNDYPHH